MTVPVGDAVGVLCAMPMELRPLRRPLALRRADVGGGPGWTGRAGGRDLVAVVSGMGTDLARRATDRLLAGRPLAHVVVVGITGALEDDTPIGTLVVPEVVIDAATGAEFRPAPLGPVPPRGRMWTTDTLTTDPARLAELRAAGVIALDMETAAVAEVCERRGVPWSVFRAISDRASDGSVDDEIFAMSNQDGSPNPRAVASYVLRHPGRIPHLARLGRQSARATAVAARAACEALDCPE